MLQTKGLGQYGLVPANIWAERCAPIVAQRAHDGSMNCYSVFGRRSHKGGKMLTGNDVLSLRRPAR